MVGARGGFAPATTMVALMDDRGDQIGAVRRNETPYAAMARDGGLIGFD